MLIRLCGHFIDNPNHIDKLICINGLPQDWFLRPSRFGGNELVKPWEPDVEANIPKEIRHLCEPIDFIQVFPPTEKGREHTVDKRTAIGLRFDYMMEAGELLWEKIEKYVERSVPRDYVIPKPVLVAPNHKSNFDPHEARRNSRRALELRPAEIPVIDLHGMNKTLITTSAPVESVVQQVLITQPDKKQKDEGFRCERCAKVFDKERALSMHAMRAHAKEKVGV